MTHADRSEPVWPPHARNAYQQPTDKAHEERGMTGHLRGPNGYRCCKHCGDDSVHDVETDGHDALCSTCDSPNTQTLDRLEAAERALADERAKVARVEALAEEYEERSSDTENAERYPWGVAADDIRAALAGDA